MKLSVKKMVMALGCVGASLLSHAYGAGLTKVDIGMAGWTGFAPLSLAKESGIFAKHGLDVTLHMIPSKERHLALASGSIQCAATTVEIHVMWNTMGVPITQIFQLDKSYGADGVMARNNIKSITDLKGKTVAVSAAGTSPYFGMAWMLRQHGLSMKDINIAMLEPQAATQAFLAGQYDAAFSYEPYLSSVRDKPQAGHVLATTVDYPMVMDTVGCSPDWLKKNPQAARAMADSYFEALELMKAKPDESNKIMGSVVKQSAAEFAQSANFLRWQNREENIRFFNEEIEAFMKQAATLMYENKIIRTMPQDFKSMYDTQFIKP